MSESIACTSIRKVRSTIAFTAAILLVTLGNWFVVANLALADQPNKQARQKVNEGLEQYSSGNFEQAAKSFAEAAQAAPDNPIIKFDEACAVSAAGDDDKARELLLQASVSSDPQVSAAACYNLAAIAAKRGRKELGDDPMAATAEVRQAALDKLKIAVTHYRDCLRIAPEHPDARHNLELVLTLTNYLQQQWQMRDHQQALEKMSLFELLKHLDDQQLSLRSATLPYKGQSAAKVSRFERSKMAAQQLKLLDDIPSLKSKIDAQLANNPEDAAQSPNGTPRSEASQQTEVEAQLRKIVTEQIDQASQAMRQAAEDVQSANWDRALGGQRFTIDCLRQLQALFSAFPENLDLAIELQESLIETKENGTPSSTTSNLAIAAKKDRSADGQAWQQDWVSNFSQSLAAKASATLQSLPKDEPASQPEEAPVKEPQLKDGQESENQKGSNEASPPEAAQTETSQAEASQPEVSQESTSQTDVNKPELDSSEVSELTPVQQKLKQQEEITKQLRKALERTVELAPTILERSNEAKRLIVESQSSAARPAQEDVLRMLKEIRDLLPKQPNQQQDQNQNQNQDQNQNKDQKDSDQQKQNEQQDSKSDDQKQNPENGQEQGKDQNSEKSDQNNDGDKSQQEKKPDTEKSQPKDKPEEAEKKSPSEQAKEQAKEQAAKESEKANPDSKAAEQTAQQMAEQRAQAVLRRIREREAKYRELLQQLRERQAQQTPVEKDW